ncbi:MAG: M23 family metallopeptidase [Clostridiales bacterium]|jgi:murein DD-endopeptidase MepM/ murein hydrolase activator NlpD|nr:M23 family metallopeptidase [Clostridiales bacterium]
MKLRIYVVVSAIAAVLLCGAAAVPPGVQDNFLDETFAEEVYWTEAEGEEGAPPDEPRIRWAEFTVPAKALRQAAGYAVEAHGAGMEADWIAWLAMVGTKYGGNWGSFRAADLQKAYAGDPALTRMQSSKYYAYYYEVYTAVLKEFIGGYTIYIPDGDAEPKRAERFGLTAFSPIAEGYGYTHYDDFGAGRGYGYRRRHLGNDVMGSVGTPVCAVEGGTVTELGWNRYGGWRVGIRSRDGLRYWYYAHLRKDRPYAKGLEKGAAVSAGDVIGYLGMTGYSVKENVNNIKVPHLHFGLQLIFHPSQEKGVKEIWVDTSSLLYLLDDHRVTVTRTADGEAMRKYQITRD